MVSVSPMWRLGINHPKGNPKKYGPRMVDYYWTIIRYLGLPIAFLLLRDYTNYNKKLSNSGGGPLAHFFIAVFWFYQSVFRDDTSPVIGGEMPISWHMNVKWYRYGQPKAEHRRHFD